MADILFYHLTSTPFERCVPEILEKTLDRGWRALIRLKDIESAQSLDQVLWNYRTDSFLPHGMSGGDHDAEQPILISTEKERGANAPDLLVLSSGTEFDLDECESYSRICLFFNGNDEAELEAARRAWKEVKAKGVEAQYWAQKDGRWVKSG